MNEDTFTCTACGETFAWFDRGYDYMCADCTDDRNHAYDDLIAVDEIAAREFDVVDR